MNASVRFICRRLVPGILALTAVGSCPRKASAEAFGWNTSGGGSWITDTNWTPVLAGDWPKDAGDVADLSFDLTAPAPITLDAAITVGALTIGDADASHSFALSDGAGGSLTFDNSGLAAALTQAATGLGDTVSATLRTAGDLTVTNLNTTASRVFTLSGPLASSALAGVQMVTFAQPHANAAVLMSGTIGDGATGGSIALTKTGAGTLTLGAANGYTGGTTLGGGTLVGNAANAIAGTVAQSAASTLRINNHAAAPAVDAAAGAIVNASAGTLSMHSNAVPGNAVSVALGALNVSGNYAIRAAHNGTELAAATIFTLDAPLTISGAPVITSSSGANASVAIGGLTTLNSDVTIGGSTAFRFTTLVEDGTPRKITHTGGALLNILGAASYSGGTDVLGGTVQFSAAGASGSGVIQVGETLGASSAEIRVSPGVTVANHITVRAGSTGTSKISRDTGAAGGTGTYSGTISLQKGTIFENASSGGPGTAMLDITGQVTGAGQKITVQRGSSPNNQLIRFSNPANDFGFASATDDAITVGSGVFIFTSDAALGAAGNNVTFTGGAGNLRAEGVFSTARKLTFSTAGSAVDAAAGSELTLTADGQIAGAVGFTKGTAAGTVVITGDNSARTQGTAVNGGTLRIGSAANIGTASAVTLANHGVLSLANDAATTLANPITIANVGGVLNADRAAGGVGDGLTHTFGKITAGTHPVTFTNGNNYSLTTGAVTATDSITLTNHLAGTGELRLAGISATNSAAMTLTLAGVGTTFVTGNLTQGGLGAVSLAKTGAGTATLQGGANSFGGNVAVSGGTLRVVNATGLGAGSGTVTLTNPGSTLDLRSDAALSLATHHIAMNTTGTVLHLDQAVGGAGTGVIHAIGNLSIGGTSVPVISGGNGYGLAAGVLGFVDSGGLENNAPGPVAFASATVDSASGETITFRGTGSTVITGGISQLGAGIFHLLKLDGGLLAIDGLIGTGAASLAADGGTVAIAQSQTLAALAIGAGGAVILDEAFNPAPGGFAAGAFHAGPAAATVPEPGAFSLLALGAVGLFARHRARARARMSPHRHIGGLDAAGANVNTAPTSREARAPGSVVFPTMISLASRVVWNADTTNHTRTMTTHRASHPHVSPGRSALTALAVTIAALATPAYAQFEITTGVGNTSQNFDTLLNTGASNPWTNDSTIGVGAETLDGWSLFTPPANPVPTYRANQGNTNNGGIYSFGASAATERALGGIGSSGFPLGYIAFAATNTSASNLASFTLGFDGEQWRNGGNTTAQTMVFEYGIGATFDAVSWTAPGNNFNWTSPVVGATAATVDGNAEGLQAARGGTINGLTWGTGQTLWLRWVEVNDAGNDHGLAIDNFAFSWAAGAAPKNLTWTPSTPVWDTTTQNWTDEVPAASVFSTGDSVNFTNTGVGTVTIANPVSVGLMTVSHTSGTYNFGGAAITSNQALQKTGAGTLIMATTFSQGLNATAGTVRLAVPEVFADTGTVTLGDGVVFDLNSNNETIGALNLTGNTITTGTGLLTIGGNVTVQFSPTDLATTISGKLSTGTAPRTVSLSDGVPVVDFDLDADLSGTGRLGFTGSGTVRIGGDNSAFGGNLQLNSGLTYLIETDKPFGTNTIFLNGGTIDNNTAFTGVNKVTNALSLGGVGATFVGENIDFAGAITFFSDDGAKTFDIADTQTVTFSGTLSGTDSLTLDVDITKQGLGTLVLNADASAYTGNITVINGQVIAGANGSLGTGNVDVSPLGFPDVTLTISASQKISALTIGEGAIVSLSTVPPPPAESLAAPVAVPEPAGAALLACGALGLLGRRRQRKSG